MNSKLIWTIALTALATAGCGSDHAAPTGDGIEANYLMSTAMIGPDTYSGLVFPLESVTTKVSPDQSTALEVAEGGWSFAIPDTRSFLVSHGSQLTRWSLSGAGFQEERSMSLANLGTSEIRTVRVIDGSRAWIAVDRFIVQFDPTLMEITQTTEFDELVEAGWTTSASLNSENYLRGNSLFFTFTRWNFETFASFPEMALVAVNTATGKAELSRRSGCGDIDSGFVDDADVLWLATGSRAVLDPLVRKEMPTSCLVKIPPGVTTLGEAEVVNLGETTGRVVANLMPFATGVALVRSLDESKLVLKEDSTVFDVAVSEAWGWAELHLDGLRLETRLDLPTAPVITSVFKVDGQPLIGVSSSDFATTTFYLAAPDGTEPTVTVPGAPLGFAEFEP